MGRYFIILILFFQISFAHSESLSLAKADPNFSCAELLNSPGDPQFQKLILRLNNVNEDLFVQFQKLDSKKQNPVQFYLLLKAEFWKMNPRGEVYRKDRPHLSADLVSKLKLNFSKQYDIESLTEDELYIFYTNLIHGLYASAAHLIKENFIDHHFVDQTRDPKARAFAHDLMASILYPIGLEEREVDPERALRILDQELGTLEFWSVGFELFSALHSIDEELDWKGFRNWLNDQPKFLKLDSDQRVYIQRALHGFKGNSICCLTNPGCILCPHNRRHIKKDKKRPE